MKNDLRVQRAEKFSKALLAMNEEKRRLIEERKIPRVFGDPMNFVEWARVVPLLVEIDDSRIAVVKLRSWLKMMLEDSDGGRYAPDLRQGAIDACALLVATYPWIVVGA